MPHTEAELIAARFARMKSLVACLELAYLQNADPTESFLKLKQELEDTRVALQLRNDREEW